MKMYRANRGYAMDISQVDVIKKTGKTVFFIGRNGKENREAILSGGSSWHETFEDAQRSLINECTGKISQYKSYIETEEERIANIKALTPNQ